MKAELTVASTSSSDSSAGTIYAVSFKDKRHVTLLSTCFTARMVNTNTVDKRTNQPELVHQYNQHMNGVDNFDLNIQYYSSTGKPGSGGNGLLFIFFI